MKAFGQKRDPARLFLKRLGFLALLGIVIVAGSGVFSVYQKERESRELRLQAENEYADLVDREARLKEDIETLNTDRGMEAALRQQYALAEEGEGLIVIVEPDAPPPVQATTSSFSRWFEKLLFWR